MNKTSLELLIKLKDEASEGIGKIGGAVKGMGVAVAAGATVAGAALIGVGVDAVNAAADFETGMNRLNSVAGGSMAEAGLSLDQFKDKALQLGMDTQFSAAQAQDAMINLAKGGVPVKDILGGATTAVLDLAAAGELELGPAAEIVAKQLGVWGETGVAAADVANLMAQAANASTVDVDELANGLANAQGAAKAAGLSYQDTVQTMALLAPNFSSANEAGTSLKTMLINLQPKSSEAAAMMADLGITTFDSARAYQFLADKGIKPASNSTYDVSTALRQYAETAKLSSADTTTLMRSFENSRFYDAEGNFKGMANAAAVLNETMVDLSAEEKIAALKEMFGDDALTAASALVTAGESGFKKMGEQMTAAGTAAEQAKLKQKGFNFAMDQLKGSIETASIVLGDILLPIATDVVNNALLPMANAALSFLSAIGDGTDASTAFTNSFGPMLEGIKGFLASIGVDVSAIPAMVSGITTPITDAFDGLVKIATHFADNISKVLSDNPKLLGETLGAAWNVVYNLIKIPLDLISGIIKALGEAFTGIGEPSKTMEKTLTNVFNSISEIMGSSLEAVYNTFTLTIGVLAPDAAKYMEEFKTKFKEGLEAAKEKGEQVLNDFLQLGKDIINGVIKGIRNAPSAVFDALKAIIIDQLDAVKAWLGIKSPSRFTAAQIGRPMAQGIAMGIAAEAKRVKAAMVSVVDSAVTAGQGVASGAGAILGPIAVPAPVPAPAPGRGPFGTGGVMPAQARQIVININANVDSQARAADLSRMVARRLQLAQGAIA